MKKYLSFALVAFALILVSGKAEAVGVARSPKHPFAFGYTTAITSVTLFTVLQSTTGITEPGAVYQVQLTSGVAQDFCVLYDTTTAVGLTPPTLANESNLTAQLGTRFLFGSTTQNTTFTLDPPWEFYTGLMVACTGAQDGGMLTFEVGRGLSGQ
jgi:hypothetical protein